MHVNCVQASDDFKVQVHLTAKANLAGGISGSKPQMNPYLLQECYLV